MNRTGVALAADSAVTISFLKRPYEDDEPNPKIYNSNKLFMLSKFHPVGIMIYGNASLIGVPWEIIIKNYRKQALKDDSFDYVEDYAKHFLNYLGNSDLHFPEQVQETYVYHIFIDSFKEALQRVINILDERKDEEIKDKELQQIFIEEASKYLTELENLESLNDFHITEKEFFDKYDKVFLKGFEDIKNDFPFTAKIKQKLRKAVYLNIVKNTFERNDGISGIVITGFGDKEIYPSLVSYMIEAVVDNKTKYLPQSDIRVGREADAFITPFAQGEMVRTFMEGVVPSYKRDAYQYVFRLLNKYPDVLIEKVEEKVKIPKKTKDSLTKQLKDISKDIFREFADEMENRIREKNTYPILRAVEALPLEELASMAEAFVNLTSFKRRVTPVLETVGGPVDVAVISKGDGFVWIKRKHYFERDKNPHFFANYYV